IGHDDAYGPVRVVGAVSRIRAGDERDTYQQGNKISTSHGNTGHAISLGIQSEQEIPITPDPRSDDAGQITEVRKDHIGSGWFEAKLDPSRHRYEAWLERRRERPLEEMGEPEGDRRSAQTHERA